MIIVLYKEKEVWITNKRMFQYKVLIDGRTAWVRTGVAEEIIESATLMHNYESVYYISKMENAYRLVGADHVFIYVEDIV